MLLVISSQKKKQRKGSSICWLLLCCRLDGNSLVTLHLPSLATHPSLEAPHFYLAGNPLLCDCHMDYLAKMPQLTQTGEDKRILVLCLSKE